MKSPGKVAHVLLLPVALVVMGGGAAVYWFSWLCIQVLLVITAPLCWLGKQFVAGRQTIRAKVKEFVDWYEGRGDERSN